MLVRALRWLGAVTLLGLAGSVAVPTPAQAAPPLFQLPFECGQQWKGTTGSGAHSTPWEIDFNWGSGTADLGKPVLAAAAGTISIARYETTNGYGNRVVIRHQNTGYTTQYAHLEKFAPGLKVNDTVRQGQLIGYVGASSAKYSLSPHLHYEVRNANVLQPAYFNGIRFGYPTQTVTSRNCGNNPKAGALRDVTGDGKSDLLAVDSSGNRMYRYAGSGTG
ncbi:M23 family metallopeptidase, partial [Polymorphospora sp. NPDC051019]|uniref:M23 family metallopeptidase n=1 Tax=Polymorphospora sp. NPDC051019 TaxID=3155725 RepID=UPI00341CD25F